MKTEARLRDHVNATLSSRGHPQRAVARAQGRVRMVNRNFRELSALLAEKSALGSVDCLLADLGFSSMQIDDPQRGFTYKASGPLDMRMDPSNTEQQTAYELLCQMGALGRDGEDELASILVENSDEEPARARDIAAALLESGAPPVTTGELSERVRRVVRRLDGGQEAEAAGAGRDLASKKAEDAVLARVFQSLRICVNQGETGGRWHIVFLAPLASARQKKGETTTATTATATAAATITATAAATATTTTVATTRVRSARRPASRASGRDGTRRARGHFDVPLGRGQARESRIQGGDARRDVRGVVEIRRTAEFCREAGQSALFVLQAALGSAE